MNRPAAPAIPDQAPVSAAQHTAMAILLALTVSHLLNDLMQSVSPFALVLPHVGLLGTEILAALIGFIIASAFSAILVFAQELVPSRVRLISGLFFGFAFGVAGIGAAALGVLADHYGLTYVYLLCSFLPLLGIVTAFLPDLSQPHPTVEQ